MVGVTREAGANPTWATDKVKSAEEVISLFRDSAQGGKGGLLEVSRRTQAKSLWGRQRQSG